MTEKETPTKTKERKTETEETVKTPKEKQFRCSLGNHYVAETHFSNSEFKKGQFREIKYTHLDHCHKTGKIRGILCLNCNTSLGKFNDDPFIILCAAKYLIEAGNEYDERTITALNDLSKLTQNEYKSANKSAKKELFPEGSEKQ
eukprot:gene12204-5791_t